MMRFAPIASLLAVALVSVNAVAADDEEGGGEKKAKVAASATTTTAVATSTGAQQATGTDHEAVNGHIGVGYLGRVDVPLGAGGNTMAAHILGIRYWTSSTLAITGGIGFGSTSSSAKSGGTTVDGPSATSFALKGGVALPLTTGKHYAFVVEPQLIIGYATQTIKPAGGGDNTDNSGTSIGIGATAGAEIQFGFIGIPELAMVGSVGLAFQTQSGKTKTGSNEVSGSQTSISTFTLQNPWNIFAGNVAAIYYF